jgi:beta-lactamase class C
LFKPQSQFLYSNIGFSLLGKDLASREHQTFEQLMQNNVLSPLNMHETVLTVDGVEYKSYANGYTATEKPARTAKYGLLGASWAMKSTMSDMRLYLKAMLALNNTPASLLPAIKTAQTGYIQLNTESNYPHQIGLGWSIAPLNDINANELLVQPKNKNTGHTPLAVTTIANAKYIDNALIEKTGSTDGFRAYIGVIPNQKIGVVILINKFTPNYNKWKQFGRSFVIN